MDTSKKDRGKCPKITFFKFDGSTGFSIEGASLLESSVPGRTGQLVAAAQTEFVNLTQSILYFAEAFDRALKNVIDSFERAREWADLSNCLQRVRK